MEARTGPTSRPLEAADIAAWLGLFDRLNITLGSTKTPEARRLFRGLGPRRHAHAHCHLIRERQQLLVEFEILGIRSGEEQPAFPVEIVFRESLKDHYVKLADAFVKCSLLATRMGNDSLTRWLLERARMHRQQALFLSM